MGMPRFVTPAIRKKVIERDKGCVYCGKPVEKIIGDDAPYAKRWKAYDASGEVFHFEHRQPHAIGGKSDESNINLSCAKCNLEKARKEASAIADAKGEPMTHSIKVSEEGYQSLLTLQRPRETFSDVVQRLLDVHAGVQQLIKVMNEVPAYKLWKAQQEAMK